METENRNPLRQKGKRRGKICIRRILLLSSVMIFVFLQNFAGCSQNSGNPSEGSAGNRQNEPGKEAADQTGEDAEEAGGGNNQGEGAEGGVQESKDQEGIENPPEENKVDAIREFVHPGILNSAEELDLMKRYAVGDEACEPWKSAYGELMELVDSYYDTASSNYINISSLNTTKIVRSNSGGWNDMRVAASKAYNLSIAYHISGKEQYAKTAREVMMRYANQFQGVGSKTDGGGLYDCNLAVGVIALKFCSAAEVLRYSGYASWSEADDQALLDMFRRNTDTDTICSMARLLDWTNDEDGLMSRYDMHNLAHGHAAFANFGAIAYAVFAEDSSLYNRIVGNLCADVSANYGGGSFSWERKPLAKGTGGAIAYNINPVTGQNKELDRDLTHSLVMVSGLVTVAQIAYHQGDAMVYECHGRLLLKGVECLAKYNLGYDVEYTGEYPWRHHNTVPSTYNRGGAIFVNPMFEAAYNYYAYQSEAKEEEYPFLEQLVNNQMLSPEAISEDVSGMGTLLYSNEERKNVYARVERNEPNTESVIFANNYMALVENAKEEDGTVCATGAGAGVITYKTPDWEVGKQPTRELGIVLSSTSTGYVEFRLQSKGGTGYGQFLESITEAGDTGTLLARIEVPNTNGETVYLKGTVYDTEGNYGGKLVNGGNPHILYVVVCPDEEEGEICYRQLTTRPDERYELAGGEPEEEDVQEGDEPFIDGLQNAGVEQIYQYGWTGSGVDFVKAPINGWDDGDLEAAFTDENGSGVCPSDTNFGNDRYLILDLGEKKAIGTIRLVTANQDILAKEWAVYGANDMDKFESTWTLIAKASEMELEDGAIEVAIHGRYRYIMIGGYGTDDDFMNTWVHCWSYMTEIQ